MANELDAFLASGNPPEPPPEPTPAPAPPPTPAPSPESAPPPVESKPAPAPKEAAQPEPDDEEPEHITDGQPTVARGAYLEERRRRQNWVERAGRAEAERDELRRQLEEAKRPPPEQPPPAPVYQQPAQIPDPTQDPVGYTRFVANQTQQVALNDRLNMSEHILRDKLPAAEVDKYIEDFKAEAAKDGALWQKLYAQPMPYQWMTKEIDRRRMHNEIGDDPSAFEQKLRAKWEAELTQRQQPLQPTRLPAPPPSLAGVRSVAGRTSSTWTGPPSLDDIVNGGRSNGAGARR